MLHCRTFVEYKVVQFTILAPNINSNLHGILLMKFV